MGDASYAIHVGAQRRSLCGQHGAKIITPLVLGKPEGCLRCQASWLKLARRGKRPKHDEAVGR